MKLKLLALIIGMIVTGISFAQSTQQSEGNTATEKQASEKKERTSELNAKKVSEVKKMSSTIVVTKQRQVITEIKED